MPIHSRLFFLTSAAVTFVVLPAHAQHLGSAIVQLDPSERGSEWFTTDSLDLRGNLRPAVGLVIEDAYRPLVITNANGNVVSSIVQDQLRVHLGGSLVLWDRLRLAFDLPVQAFADSGGTLPQGTGLSLPAHSTALGDVHLAADARIVGTHGDPFTAALGVEVFLPTGDSNSYAGDGDLRVAPRLLIAGDASFITYAARVGIAIRGANSVITGVHEGSYLFGSASVGVRVLNRNLVVGPEVFAQSVVTDNEFLSKSVTPVEGMLSAHYTIADMWRVGAGAGPGFTTAIGTPDWRALVSFEWTPQPAAPPPPDRDHDGVVDSEDACPDQAGVRTADPKTNGCPPAPPPAAPVAPADRDNDGVADSEDACPDQAGVRTADPKTNGCPPAPADRDKDGIPDSEDACPDEVGTKSPDPKKNGCPVAVVKAAAIEIRDQVKFQTGSAAIAADKDTQAVLAAVIDILKKHPEITKVHIEGHTDDRGAADMNRKLSAHRADAVVTWLTAHGVDKKRLTSEGFGADRPLEPGTSDEARRANRRVEFHIESAPEKP